MIFLILLLAGNLAAQETPLESYRVPNFQGGVVTRYSPALIPDNTLQWAKNVYFDKLGVERRKGYSQFNSATIGGVNSVRGLWPFTTVSGTRYIMALSSSNIYSATTDGVFSAIAGFNGFSATADMDAVAYLGKWWAVNGSTVVYWNGTSTKTLTEAPMGTMIEGFRNRLVISGVESLYSYVYMSEELDGEEWTTGPTLSKSPVTIAIGGTNAKPVRCLYSGFKDFLFVGTEDEIYGIYGFGRNDFVTRVISKEVGCIEDKSVQEKDGSLLWLSRRGIEKMNDSGITRISDGIKDVLDNIISNTGLLLSHTDTSLSDWTAGNLTASGAGAPMNATNYTGSVSFSSWSTTDFAWNSGTLVQTSSSPKNNAGIDIVLDGERFNDGDYTLSPVWTPYIGYAGSSDYAASADNNYLFNALTSSRVAVFFTSSTLVYGTWSFDIYISTNTGIPSIFSFISDSKVPAAAGSYSLVLKASGGTVNGLAIGAGALSCTFPPQTISAWATYTIVRTTAGLITVTAPSGSCSITDNSITASKYMVVYLDSGVGIDNIIGNMYVSTGSYTSQVFNTGFSTTVGGPFYVEDSTPSGTAINYYVRSASSSNGEWTNWTPTSDTLRAATTKQYWQYKAELETAISTSTPYVSTATLYAATTGAYIHACIPIGAISSWGNLNSNTITGGAGSVTHYISTGTTCNSVERDTATWTLQPANSPITVGTAAYAGVKDVFSIGSSTDIAILQDVTVNWITGNRPPSASSVYDSRYYLAYTTNPTASVNDFVLVYDKNDAPTFLDHMNCYSLSLFNRNLYCGSANATGKIFQLESGEDDDGAEFTSTIRTKAYSFGDPDAEKEFLKAYAVFAPESEEVYDINITPKYRLDMSSTAVTLNTINLGEDSTAGILSAKIPFSASNNLTGRFMDFELSNTGKNQPWNLYGLSFYFRRYDVK